MTLFSKKGTFQERLDAVVDAENGEEGVKEIVDFIREDSSRAICRPRGDVE